MERGNLYFIDSGVWIGAFNPRDAHHLKSKRVVKAVANGKLGRSLITALIFGEVVTYIRRKIGVEQSIEVAKAMLDSKNVEVIHIDEHTFSAAYHMFERYPALSFADAVSVTVMKDRGVQQIISFDRDFDGVRDIVRSEIVPPSSV